MLPPARSPTTGPRRRALVLALLLLPLLLLLLHLTSAPAPRAPQALLPVPGLRLLRRRVGARPRRGLLAPLRPYLQGDLQGLELHRQWQGQRPRPTRLAVDARWARVRAPPASTLAGSWSATGTPVSVTSPLPFYCFRKMPEKIEMRCDLVGTSCCGRVVFKGIDPGARIIGCVECCDDAWCVPLSYTMVSTRVM